MKLGQSASFVCEANGNPRPSIGWKREAERPLSGANAGNNFRFFFFKFPFFLLKGSGELFSKNKGQILLL